MPNLFIYSDIVSRRALKLPITDQIIIIIVFFVCVSHKFNASVTNTNHLTFPLAIVLIAT